MKKVISINQGERKLCHLAQICSVICYCPVPYVTNATLQFQNLTKRENKKSNQKSVLNVMLKILVDIQFCATTTYSILFDKRGLEGGSYLEAVNIYPRLLDFDNQKSQGKQINIQSHPIDVKRMKEPKDN